MATFVCLQIDARVEFFFASSHIAYCEKNLWVVCLKNENSYKFQLFN